MRGTIYMRPQLEMMLATKYSAFRDENFVKCCAYISDEPGTRLPPVPYRESPAAHHCFNSKKLYITSYKANNISNPANLKPKWQRIW
jgi:hypothetical protein